MKNTPKVISNVVEHNLCIGCGLCLSQCPNGALSMEWDNLGFLVPKLTGECDNSGACINVCPFNPNPENEVRTENELSNIFLKETSQFHEKIGKYNNIYVGYSNEFRNTSSSGGIATYILNELLNNKIIDHVISVKESSKENYKYEYQISSNKEQLLEASKTKYYPVTLGNIFEKIHQIDGTFAVVGVGCFIKAIRLAQYYDNKLETKIKFLIGIICGGIKSKFFTDYLGNKAGVDINNIEKPQYRIKDHLSTASDYSFGCYDNKNHVEKLIKMKLVGDMWGTGLFKANACDFCDDVTTELADISLGDAWLNPYNKDGMGTNVIVARSEIAENIISNAILNNEIHCESLHLETFLLSQQGSFNHRHLGLLYRMKKESKKHVLPPKRFNNHNISTDFKIVQYLRQKTRERSLIIWGENQDVMIFDNSMKLILKALKLSTCIYHYKRRFSKLIIRIK